MQKRSSFLQISLLIMSIALIGLAAAGGQPARAGVPAQETNEAAATEATATVAATTAVTAEGTTAATAVPTVIPTMGGDEAYPPCPKLPVPATATEAATAEGTAASAGEAAAVAPEATATAEESTNVPTVIAAATLVATTEASSASQATAAATAEGTAAAPTAAATSAVEVVGFENTNGCILLAVLSGANEVPNAGDPDAAGTALVFISRPETGTGTICFRIESTGLTLPAAAAHIHTGPAGIAGKVVVPFNAPGADGKAEGCTKGVDRSLIKAILLYPDTYYVNVHTSDFQAGAIRGQLTPQ